MFKAFGMAFQRTLAHVRNINNLIEAVTAHCLRGGLLFELTPEPFIWQPLYFEMCLLQFVEAFRFLFISFL